LILLVCSIYSSIMAQKINLDSLNVDHLNLYKDKAVTLRNTGIIFTICGVAATATAFIILEVQASRSIQNPVEIFEFVMGSHAASAIIGTVGIASIVVGIPMWAVGGSRNAKAELKLQKFNIAPKNSMAIGLGITLRF
jgi:hypothetical protein